MVLTEAEMELYHGPLDQDVAFNYKSKLFKSTWEKLKGNIKACPHCGGTKYRMADKNNHGDYRYIAVVCSSCKAVGPKSPYNVWHTGDLKEWHLYDKDMVDITKDEVVQKAIDLWNN